MSTRSTFSGSPFGVGLTKARLAAGLTQKQVADAVGKGQGTVAAWECGRSEPSISMLLQLMELYSVGFDSIIDNTPHPATITADEMQLVMRFRKLSKQNKEAIEATMCIYEKYQDGDTGRC